MSTDLIVNNANGYPRFYDLSNTKTNTFKQGDVFKFVFDVKNNGTDATNSSIGSKAAVYVDDGSVFFWADIVHDGIQLSSGSNIYFSGDYDTSHLTEGEHALYFVADYWNNVLEGDEANNVVKQLFYVTKQTIPLDDNTESNNNVVDVIEAQVLDYSLSIDETEIDEGSEDTITFTVSASGVSDVDVKIPFTLSGSAVANKDYQGKLTETSFFTIPAGEISVNLSFTANVDFLVENDETVILTLAKPSNQGKILEGKSSATAMIHDVYRGKNTAEKWVGLDKNDKAFGNGGNDILTAGLGDDTVDGGDDNDKITGGKGVDVLSGGAGKDTFIFKKGDSNNETDFADTILDLEKGDSIDLSGISKTFNFIKTVASDLNGSNLKLSGTKFDVYVANLDGDNYLVYETNNGSSHEIVAIGSEIQAVNSWVLKSGILSV
jgi:Ca2+-binding RTX toxin-like protein